MLTHLELHNLVIVDRAELDFGLGLTALTGETGAGKSIIVDALLLIAGGRAGGDVVRQGAERAEITASFTALPAPARSWLDAQAIEHEGDIIIRRVIGADGRSRAYVNGRLVPLQLLRDCGEFLLEIHGQQEFQHLVKRGAQRDLLDEDLDSPGLKRTVADLSAAARACRRDYDAQKAAAANRETRLDLLRYQLRELKAEVSTVASIEEVFVEQKRISGRSRLQSAAQTALNAIYEADADSAHDLLAKAQGALRGAGDADPQLVRAAKLLEEATILTHEAAEALRHCLDDLQIDPARQEEIERHAAALEALARKHRLTVIELPAQLRRTEEELQALETAELSLAERERQLELLSTDYHAAADLLSAARARAAERLGGQITELMQTLGMAGGRFAASIARSETEFGPQGSDDVEFLVSANPGQPLKSLANVASGGELSRIALAIQVAAAAGVPGCRVFDEVDAGIGGGIAEIVGRQLRELGGRSQVLCVTHLAQVAAQAHSQFRVIKHTDGTATRTVVEILNTADRVDEIARMLGGVEITDQARAHAREMLGRAAGPVPRSAAPAVQRTATRSGPLEPTAAKKPRGRAR